MIRLSCTKINYLIVINNLLKKKKTIKKTMAAGRVVWW